MNKRIFFVRSQIPSSDGRISRYLSILRDKEVSYQVLAWNRGDETLSDENVTYFSKKSSIGGGYKNIFGIFLWNMFILYSLLKNVKEVKCIHAVDFDSILPCYVVSRMFSLRLIFDSYDRYSDSRAMKGLSKKFVDFLETHILENAEFSILPSSKRLLQYNVKKSNNIVIFENVPNLTEDVFLGGYELKISNQKKFDYTFCYVGILERTHRGIEIFLEVFSRYPQFSLIVAGDGPLSNLVKEYSSNFSNITYLGAVDYDETKQILSYSDLHLAFYYLTSPNHKYAAPNKYYEHLFFGRPLLTTVNTPPGDLVSSYNTGFALFEGKDYLEMFLQTLDREEVNKRGVCAKRIWEENYSSYYSNYMIPTYLNIIE